MKKFTFVLAVMLIASFAFAQKGFLPRIYDLEKASVVQKATQVQHNTKDPGDIIWEEDFDEADWGATSSNGNPVPGNAPEGYTLVDGNDAGYFWRWSDVGPRGAYTGGCEYPAEDALASTSGENGFLMMEADWYNTTDECTLADPYVAHDSYVEYGSIDMSANTNVLVVFEQYSRYCCGYDETSNSFFEISVDGGSTWEQIDVSPTDINVGSANPFLSEIDLTAIAGGQANVMFRFHLSGLSHYHWEIDDVRFIEPYEYDLRITDYWNDYYQTVYPQSNIDDEYDFYGGFYQQPWFVIMPYDDYRGHIENFGSLGRTNVVHNVDIYRNDAFVVKHTSNPINLEPGTSDTIWVDFANTVDATDSTYFVEPNDTAWRMFMKGEYKTVHYATADNEDQRTDNDTLIREYTIVDTALGYTKTDSASLLGGVAPDNWTSYVGDGDGVGFNVILPEPTMYDPEGASPYYLLSSVSAYIPNQREEAEALFTNGEAYMIGKVYVWNGEEYEVKISTSPRYLTLNDTNTWVTIPLLLDGFSEYLYDGGDYAIIFEFYGNYTTDRMHTFEVGEDLTQKMPGARACLIYTGGDADFGWGQAGPALTVNMTYTKNYTDYYDDGGSIGSAIQNVDFEVYPNPTNGQFTIDVDGIANVTIINAIGSVVDSFEVVGKQTVNSDLQAGVYFVRVNANGKIGTKQIVVE